LVTGGSRGLGLQIAREFARVGCRIAICARDEEELHRAADDLCGDGTEVFTVRCDISDRDDVDRTIHAVTAHFGRLDILVNNAGIIQAGPIETMTIADFEEAMGVMFWGTLYATLAVLPQMRARRGGHIVNITSVGGKISMPHLLPYTAAKFAATGFSEGLRAELASDGVHVTTIAPGLLRTGGHRNALFKGDQEAEYAWFSLGDTLPFAALDVKQAAREIVAATRRGEAERILSIPASIAARFSGAFPALSADILACVNRYLLPSRNGGSHIAASGDAIHAREPAPLQHLLNWAEGTAGKNLHQPHAD
ncbi:MAG: SDR family NAD(P)-dependent oxidoreductase, partial [Thermomicrobia bacterium]|nr:SDR family NAD(P)-dependent oxidoreductase [Thermomicrobia bacterium]